MTPLPTEPGAIDDLLTKARTPNRYATYDMTAAEARLRARQVTRHRPPRQRTADAALAYTEWTAPEDDRTPDADRAWRDLNAVCLLLLGPDADTHLADFIASQYADKAGALVFACLLHLADDSSGARFCSLRRRRWPRRRRILLFREHAHSGEYHDADHWRTELVRHRFDPTARCGDRSTAPLLTPPHMDQVHPHITRQQHPEIGTVPLPTPALVDQLRHLASPL
ncbi:hypothetical protein [Streptomyces sp. NPDC001137]|uniref:hypothetical protein n=1 Tax=Streptomyces sp. NPDC001137 TaxID=3154378 RepID=UPI003322205E